MSRFEDSGDFYGDRWRKQWPQVVPNVPVPTPGTIVLPPEISREEFDALKKDVEDCKELLKRAKQYDRDHGEPDCEIDEKVALLRKVAELVGVDRDLLAEIPVNDMGPLRHIYDHWAVTGSVAFCGHRCVDGSVTQPHTGRRRYCVTCLAIHNAK